MPSGKNLAIDVNLNLIPDGLSQHEDVSLASVEILRNELHCGTCDLRLHSIVSDGTDSASDLLRMATAKGLHAFSVTDRNTFEGVKNMLVLVEKLVKLGMDIPHFIRGMEMPATYENQDVILLAYFLCPGSEKMVQYLEDQRLNRRERNAKMCAKLRDLGLDITLEELEDECPHVVGRLHAANILVRKGYAGSNREAFHLWLADGQPAYVRYNTPDLAECIRYVREAGGVPVLAHPHYYGWLGRGDGSFEEKMNHLYRLGLLGVEVVTRDMNEGQMSEISAIAQKMNLLTTSGSGYCGLTRRDLQMFDRSMDFSRWIP